ncbi:hypothetical protein GALMADRAFT_236328 [Galerina marginata CBS 339.88]|uniref:Uncharacterized protein n=1 Tax=Galerina marginata (strain CBS 339.88) TaxID=685588 RepID=A0A067TKW4_GALM3|nr:hypothetical protein GALMADRAFT_236328 [Galerina marginata CBS 339.88]
MGAYHSELVRATARFVNLINHKDNAEIVCDDLSSIHGLYGEFRMKPRIIVVHTISSGHGLVR